MKKIIVLVAALLISVSVLLLVLAPDTLSMIVVGCMWIAVILGSFLGLFPSILYANAFRTAKNNLEQTMAVQTTENWIAVFKLDSLFHQKELDRVFSEYKLKVLMQKEAKEILSGIEEYISEDSLSTATWQNLILQIPGTLTGLGILGTFIGLISGISSVGFSSVEAALDSIATLLGGIQTAFYTSISGVILSIVFNILNRMIWNTMLREYGVFVDAFHKNVIPSTQEQLRKQQGENMRAILSQLDRIPKGDTYSISSGAVPQVSNEQAMMQQIIQGLKNGEFTFFLQPMLDLTTKKLAAVEALVRWQHPTLGILAPASFMPLLEKNGYITRLDNYIWEQVCANIRRWIDSGIRPVPVCVNISKTDLMAMDVPSFFSSMLEKYRIPPRALDLEISMKAYVQTPNATAEVAGALRHLGFKVVMDGFNGDYISVRMLQGLEMDALKLDLRACGNLETGAIGAIFDQAQRLKVEMSVEGVENASQVADLKKCGCQEAQGYFFYKPMSIDAFENLSG